jgi:hypothetical protein
LKPNLRDALAALARAFPAFLPHAAFLLLGGMLVLLEFAVALICLRQVRLTPPQMAVIAAAFILSAGWVTFVSWQRIFLFRRKAFMFFLFSGAEPGQARASANEMFPSYSAWTAQNRDLRRVLAGLRRKTGQGTGVGDRLAEWSIRAAIYSLSFYRGGGAAANGKVFALYWSHGQRTRHRARQWLKSMTIGLVLLFLCLAFPSWFFFSSAGAPLAVGIALAAVIAWFLHQAFFVPLAQAGISAALLEETAAKDADPMLAAEIEAMLAAR